MTEAQKRDAELNRLFQRLNFFLIGTSFLIVAFATVVSSQIFWEFYILGFCRLTILAHSISAIGFYLAVFFAFTNYWNIKIINNIWKTEKGWVRRREKPSELYLKPSVLITSMIKDLKDLWVEPLKYFKHPGCLLAPHTWLVPLGFSVSWLVIWFLVLPWIIPLIFGVIIPLASLLVISYGRSIVTRVIRKKQSSS